MQQVPMVKGNLLLLTSLCWVGLFLADLPAQEQGGLAEVRVLLRQAEVQARANRRQAARETLGKALQIVDGLPAGRAVDAMREKIAEQSYEVDGFRLAHRAWEACHAYRQKNLPADDRSLLRVRWQLAVVNEDLHQWRQARALQEQIYAVLLRRLGNNSRRVQLARLNLASFLWRQGDLMAAMTLVEQAHAVLQDLHENHPARLRALHYLAFIKSELGETCHRRDAEVLLQRLVQALQKVNDLDPRLQRARIVLAGTRFELGKHELALADYQEAHRILSGLHSKGHSEALSAQVGIAICKHQLGDMAQAQKIFQEVAQHLRHWPDSHPKRQRLRLRQLYLLASLGEGAQACAQARALVQGEHVGYQSTLSPRQLGTRAQVLTSLGGDPALV